MAKYEHHETDDNGWTDWIQPIRRGYKFCCCDCGLVHNMNFRVRKGRVQFQAQRNNRSTALKRRWMKKFKIPEDEE